MGAPQGKESGVVVSFAGGGSGTRDDIVEMAPPPPRQNTCLKPRSSIDPTKAGVRPPKFLHGNESTGTKLMTLPESWNRGGWHTRRLISPREPTIRRDPTDPTAGHTGILPRHIRQFFENAPVGRQSDEWFPVHGLPCHEYLLGTHTHTPPHTHSLLSPLRPSWNTRIDSCALRHVKSGIFKLAFPVNESHSNEIYAVSEC